MKCLFLFHKHVYWLVVFQWSYRSDTEAELQLVHRLARYHGAYDSVVCRHWALGGLGATDLAVAVNKACNQPSQLKFLYDIKVRCTIT